MNRYESYKDHNVRWLNKIPSHWKVQPLWSLSKKKSITENRGLELLSVYLNKGVIKFSDVSDKRTNTTSDDMSKYQRVDSGDLVLNNQQAWRGSVGVSSYTGIVSPAYIVLEMSKEFDREYSNYLFRDGVMVAHYLTCSKGVGSIQRNLYFPDLRTTPVIIPPLEEQKLISRYLDKKTEQIDRLIEKIQKKIELLKEQRTSLINQCVTKGLNPNVEMKDSGVEWIGDIPSHWNVKKLKYLVSYNTNNLREDTDPDYRFNYIEIGDVDYIEGITFKEKISFEGCPSRARRIVQPFDVIISTVRTYLRAVGTVPDIPDLICSTGFCVLRDQSGFLNQKFLSYVVKSEWFISSVISNSYGVSYPAINASELVELKIVLPSISEQESIVEVLQSEINKYDSYLESEQSRLKLLSEYRQSLISSVVTGKVRVTVDMI